MIQDEIRRLKDELANKKMIQEDLKEAVMKLLN